MTEGSVLVIGAGMAGMQASLDLVEQDFRVYLVESKPTIGGKMAQLDKMFPTGECSMCTQLPKMLEITSNPNITLMAFSEVVGLEGSPGDFKVKVLKKPTFVDAMKCTACTECFPACPVGDVPMEFDFGMSKSKAITFYSPFPPRKAIIDPEACTYIKEKRCGEGDVPPCVEACKPEAIDFTQTPQEVDINVGAIVVASGAEPYRPETSKFGYGEFENVLTSIEFERLLSGVGPTGGVVKRKDGNVPKRVAWIQCVGPKDLKRGEEYCSSTCCMSATTEALGTLERDKDSEVHIIHDDIVAYAKGFQEYYRDAEETGVAYVRSKVENVTETEEKNLRLSLRGSSGDKELEVEMLVLSTVTTPNPANESLAGTLGVELDAHGFFKERDLAAEPTAATREGVFLCGGSRGPGSIPEAVAGASAAAAGASALLKDARGTALVEVEETPQIEVAPEDEPKIGVLVCHCGANIAGFIDVDDLAEYARDLPDVVAVEHDLFGCGGGKLKEMIVENGLNRVVVAACSPKTHEHLFGLHCGSVGLNKYLMEMANIRNHCSWVHMDDKVKATEKAKKLTRMGVARARLLEPLDKIHSDVIQKCLVIGGGISGMTCALRLADMGFEVHLVEKENELGGALRDLNSMLPGEEDPSALVSELADRVESSELIKAHLNTEIVDVDGFVGRYEVSASEGGDDVSLSVGAIVVATGADEMKPTGLYKYGENPNVITQLELEERLKAGKLDQKEQSNVVFISCVGAKEVGEEDNQYCCRIGCENILKNARIISQTRPDIGIHILHRDMTLPNKHGEGLRKELEGNDKVRFIRYTREEKPVVNGDSSVVVRDSDSGEKVKIESDLVVLTSPLVGREENATLSEMLRTQLGPGNFFVETLGNLKPLDFVTDGIFLCGTAHSPKGVPEAISDAEGAASRVATLISKDRMEKEPALSFVVDEKCDGCAYCVDPCPFDAITLIEYLYEGELKKTVDVNEAVCKGCGICMATCPKDGIYVRHFRPEQFSAIVEAALEAIE